MTSSPPAISYNKKSPTIKRILREASELASSPSVDYHAAPLETNLFEWHFTVRGPPGTAYSSGIYHGRITLPPSYPLRPPSFRFLTPSGRFEVNREICLSISGHHEDTWQPAWGVRTAVVALRAFMESEASGQVGGMECSSEQRTCLAVQSVGRRCDMCGKTNRQILEDSAAKPIQNVNVVDETVPSEIKIGYKSIPIVDVGTSARMQRLEATGLPPPQPHRAQLVTPTTPPTLLQYRPPQPNYRLPVQTPQPVQVREPRRYLYQAIPWIDRLIYALIALLLAVVMKRLHGFQIL